MFDYFLYLCTMERRDKVFEWLDSHNIAYTWYEHPEAPTIEIARQYWLNDGSKHCKNLFFRNHKGNRHYLVYKSESTTNMRQLSDSERITEIAKMLSGENITDAAIEQAQILLGK